MAVTLLWATWTCTCRTTTLDALSSGDEVLTTIIILLDLKTLFLTLKIVQSQSPHKSLLQPRWRHGCACVCMQMCVCGSELICLLQSPLSPVQRCLIYALVPLILWLALKWHHPSALTPACSPLTLPFPDDTFHPRHDLSGPWAADKSASARVQSQR